MTKIRIESTLFFVVVCFIWASCENEVKNNDIHRGNNGQSGDNASGDNSDNGGDADADGDMDSDADGDRDTDSDNAVFEASTDTGTEAVCLDLDFNIEASPVRVMILEDISGSMAQGGNPNKWTQAKSAIATVMKEYEKTIDFGLDVFPNGPATANSPVGGCKISDPLKLDCGKSTAAKIEEILEGIKIKTLARTPLWASMRNFTDRDYAPIFTNGRFVSYLLVISDGNDTCPPKTVDGGVEPNENPPLMPGAGFPGGGGTLGANLPGATNEQLVDITRELVDGGINTLVIGFGDQISNPAQLDAIAQNGGTGVDTHFKAADEKALAQQLTDILYRLIGCNYEIGEQEEKEVDLDNANFFFDGKAVGHDKKCAKGKGWTWADKDRTKVKFCEAPCKKLKNGKITTVTAQFGCPTIEIGVY